ncbi:hypothetical protein, partial [Kitasatospora sp. NPDC097691]|uniref:hypothetical protein n=1 Tax=Kitasatospora sp. NPDC097691 TaxID=3157231 RepID=UPI00332544A7
MSNKKTDLSTARGILSSALNELEISALKGRHRTEAIQLAAEALGQDLSSTTVSEWFTNGTPAKDFETLWSLVRVLLVWSEQSRPGTRTGPARAGAPRTREALAREASARPDDRWAGKKELWKTRWEQARESKLVTSQTHFALPRERAVPEAGWWRSSSDYLRGMVRGLAPAELIGRDDELALLHRFCASDRRFMWWRGEAWSGKTALLATLVMHP